MNNKIIIYDLIKLLFIRKKSLIAIFLCMLITALISVSIPLISQSIMDYGFITKNFYIIVQFTILIFTLHLCECFLKIVQEKNRLLISNEIENTLNKNAFIHLIKLKIDYYNNKNMTDIINALNVDIQNILIIAEESTFYIISQILNMIGGVVGLLVISKKLSLLVICFIPLKIVASKKMSKKNQQNLKEFIEKNQAYNAWYGDTLGGVKEIKHYNIFNKKLEEFNFKINSVITARNKMDILNRWNEVCNLFSVYFLIAIIYIIAGKFVVDAEISIGGAFAFISYTTYVTTPITSILNIGYIISGVLPSAHRYYEFMNRAEEENRGKCKEICHMDIVFRNVSFYYNNQKKVLSNINFTIKEGSKCAIIGRNGSGKSSIINLIIRLYHATKGEVIIDNKNILTLDIDEYRKKISLVSQKVYLFNSSIKENICLYEDIKQSEIDQVIEDSGLTDFIREVTLDYKVGENGAKLSGGQKQKIALARALVHDRPILIFDEATSNTDVYLESHLNKLVETKLNNKTLIIITHRKEILRKMDQIILIENGEIVGEGDYKNLYLNNQKFQDIINSSE